jgi:hypothetical protein
MHEGTRHTTRHTSDTSPIDARTYTPHQRHLTTHITSTHQSMHTAARHTPTFEHASQASETGTPHHTTAHAQRTSPLHRYTNMLHWPQAALHTHASLLAGGSALRKSCTRAMKGVLLFFCWSTTDADVRPLSALPARCSSGALSPNGSAILCADTLTLVGSRCCSQLSRRVDTRSH